MITNLSWVLPGRILLLLVALVTAWSAVFPEPGTQSSLDFSPDKLLERVRVLSSPELGGRGIGSPGVAKAAEYIAAAFDSCGLAAAGDNETFFQSFSALGSPSIAPGNSLVVNSAAGRQDLEVGYDWQPLFFSANGSVEAPAVFAGYGVTDPSINVDDYAGVTVKNKIVVALRYEPGTHSDPGTRPRELSLQSDLRFKAAAAATHGALALVVITGPEDSDEALPTLGEGWAIGTTSLPVVMVKRETLVSALASTGLNLSQLARKENDGRPKPLVLEGLRFSLSAKLKRGQVSLVNVLGLIQGEENSQTVVIGAHYDHLGKGGRGSLASKDGELHPGADDNASGTAALVEIACHLAGEQNQLEPAGSILFAAFAGEENGLLGSTYLAKHPVVPLSSTRAMINMDMVGRLRDHRLVVFGTGTALEFPKLLARLSRKFNLTITSNADGYGPSDHTPFTAEGVPVLHFFTGTHRDYHRPSDTWDKINARGMATVATAVAQTANLVLARGEPLTPGPPQPQPRLAGGHGYGAYLGIIPDFSRASGGVLLGGVREESPAGQAGLLKGDILRKVGEVEIEDLYDLTYALRSHKPGDPVTIKYLRAGRRKRTEAKLGRR